MFTNSITFDTSLFQANDPELAKEVDKICRKEIGIEGLNNIKIPWAQAKGLVKKHGKLYNNLVKFKSEIADVKRRLKGTPLYNYPNRMEKRITETTSYNRFYNKLNYYDKLFDDVKNTAVVVMAVRGS